MIKNPFRSDFMRGAFDKALRVYRTRGSGLFGRDGQPKRGNSWAVHFWRGYEGAGALTWDRKSRQSSGYAWYRAGQMAAEHEPVIGFKDKSSR